MSWFWLFYGRSYQQLIQKIERKNGPGFELDDPDITTREIQIKNLETSVAVCLRLPGCQWIGIDVFRL